MEFNVKDEHKEVYNNKSRKKIIPDLIFVFNKLKRIMCKNDSVPLKQYFVEPPFTAVRAARLLGSVSTSMAHVVTEIFAHFYLLNS